MLSTLGVSVMPVGGREKVLGAFDRRAEFSNRLPFVFIVDKDMWVYGNMPDIYRSHQLISTDGYSIENDIIADGELIDMMTVDERHQYQSELEKFLHWYALALHRGVSGQISLHPNLVLSGEKYVHLCSLLPDEVYPENLFLKIKSDYIRVVRGKSVMALLLRQLSRPGRGAKHSASALLELVANRPGPKLSRIFGSVENCLKTQMRVQ